MPVNVNYFNELQKSASKCDSIELIDNFIEVSKLAEYFKDIDIIVLPFKNIENSGSVIMAMGYAKPIIAPSLGIIEEKLTEQKELLYHNDINESFNEVRKKTISDLIKIGEKNRQQVLTYNWDKFAECFK